jgi:hypothetical protein
MIEQFSESQRAKFIEVQQKAVVDLSRFRMKHPNFPSLEALDPPQRGRE